MAPFIILAYTGEILVLPSDLNSPITRQIIKALRFSEEKLQWCIPFKGVGGTREQRFSNLKVRATLFAIEGQRNSEDKDIFILGSGKIKGKVSLMKFIVLEAWNTF